MANVRYAFIDKDNLVVNCFVFDENDLSLLDNAKSENGIVDAILVESEETRVLPLRTYWNGVEFVTPEDIL